MIQKTTVDYIKDNLGNNQNSHTIYLFIESANLVHVSKTSCFFLERCYRMGN